MYRATVTTNDQEQKHYIGMTESSFKSRFRNHKMSFNNEKYSSSTTLSTHIWKLKKTNTKHKVQWSIIKRASAFRSGAKQCNLCTAEKLCILKADKQSLLNKRSELLSKCRHRNKFYASNHKPPLFATHFSLRIASSVKPRSQFNKQIFIFILNF